MTMRRTQQFEIAGRTSIQYKQWYIPDHGDPDFLENNLRLLYILDMIEWNDELSVNNPVIDDEHRKFISILNEISSSLLSDDPAPVISMTLKSLTDYAETHFGNEEKLMQASNYPGLFVHKQRHDEFRQKVKEFNKAFREDQNITNVQELIYFMQLWFIKHIRNEDKLFSPYLEKLL